MDWIFWAVLFPLSLPFIVVGIPVTMKNIIQEGFKDE